MGHHWLHYGVFNYKAFYNNDLQTDIQLNISTSVTRLCLPPGLVLGKCHQCFLVHIYLNFIKNVLFAIRLGCEKKKLNEDINLNESYLFEPGCPAPQFVKVTSSPETHTNVFSLYLRPMWTTSRASATMEATLACSYLTKRKTKKDCTPW